MERTHKQGGLISLNLKIHRQEQKMKQISEWMMKVRIMIVRARDSAGTCLPRRASVEMRL